MSERPKAKYSSLADACKKLFGADPHDLTSTQLDQAARAYTRDSDFQLPTLRLIPLKPKPPVSTGRLLH
jgi:hypothetical protein